MTYLQAKFAAGLWVTKSGMILVKKTKSFEIKLLTLHGHSLAEFIYFYGFNHYVHVKQLPSVFFQTQSLTQVVNSYFTHRTMCEVLKLSRISLCQKRALALQFCLHVHEVPHVLWTSLSFNNMTVG